MSIALTLLADVRWRGRPVAGDRPQALLAALAARDCRSVRPDELIELVWGEDAPSNGTVEYSHFGIGSQGRRCREAVRFPLPPFNPYVRFSRIRLTDDLLDMVTPPSDSGRYR